MPSVIQEAARLGAKGGLQVVDEAERRATKFLDFVESELGSALSDGLDNTEIGLLRQFFIRGFVEGMQYFPEFIENLKKDCSPELLEAVATAATKAQPINTSVTA